MTVEFTAPPIDLDDEVWQTILVSSGPRYRLEENTLADEIDPEKFFTLGLRVGVTVSGIKAALELLNDDAVLSGWAPEGPELALDIA